MVHIREDLELIDMILAEPVVVPKVKKKTKAERDLEQIKIILLDLKDKIINEVKEVEERFNIKMGAKDLIHLVATKAQEINPELGICKETVIKRKLKSGEEKETKKMKYKITEEMIKEVLGR